MWSRIKAFNGWSVKRIIGFKGREILGGVQILFRRVKFFGSIGYAPKIPESITGKPGFADALVEQIKRVAISEGLQAVLAQPANNGIFANRMFDHGFRTCPVETAPTATVLVDLTDELDQILARMNKSMRNAVRRSTKRGLSFRVGDRNDLSTFHQLLGRTSERRGFSTFELEYFRQMWDECEPTGRMQVFLCEYEGEPVSSQVCVSFGNTVVAKQIGWSGKHHKRHPNEGLDWFTIKWAKDNGFQYYDLEGIKRPAAVAFQEGKAIPQEYENSPTSYKLKLGGAVQVYPSAYCFVVNPVLRPLYNRIGCHVADWPIFQKAVSRFRTA